MNNQTDKTRKILSAALGPSTGQYEKKLRKFRIQSIEHLWSIATTELPELSEKELRARGFLVSAFRKSGMEAPEKTKLSRLQSALGISKKQAQKVASEIERNTGFKTYMLRPHQLHGAGMLPGGHSFRSPFWSTNPKPRSFPGDLYMLPDYRRMGEVFDQGSRGTCVANAATAMIDYLSGGARTSRQFLYHQCKMIDGSPDSGGTYMDIPMRILSSTEFVDKGTVDESDWKYNTSWRDTEHQGPPPEVCFDTTRYTSASVVQVRVSSMISDMKTLLLGSNHVNPVPIIAGLPLYTSFFNEYTNRTGWVNMPLPDESLRGYHAMLVVGFDDDKEVFIVRNSWGSDLYHDNPYRLQGHVFIPYPYFEKYLAAGNGVTVLDINSAHASIDERDRLYNNMKRAGSLAGRVASFGSKDRSARNGKKSFSLRRVFFFLLLLLAAGGALKVWQPETFDIVMQQVLDVSEVIWGWLKDGYAWLMGQMGR